MLLFASLTEISHLSWFGAIFSAKIVYSQLFAGRKSGNRIHIHELYAKLMQVCIRYIVIILNSNAAQSYA